MIEFTFSLSRQYLAVSEQWDHQLLTHSSSVLGFTVLGFTVLVLMQRVPDSVCLTPERSLLCSSETHETSLVQLSCRDVISEGAGQATTVVRQSAALKKQRQEVT